MIVVGEGSSRKNNNNKVLKNHYKSERYKTYVVIFYLESAVSCVMFSSADPQKSKEK